MEIETYPSRSARGLFPAEKMYDIMDKRLVCPILFSIRIAMNTDVASLFDLSPPEKLQLVQDLWDDLAANPSAIPVHDWQKEELARRKANLMSNPASGLSWDDVKRRVRSHYGR